MNEQKQCPECKTIYRSIPEIIQAGGKTWHFGLAHVGSCGCGAKLGSVALLWRKKAIELPQVEEK